MKLDFQYLSLGITLGLAGFLLCCGLITLLYMEALWWFLVLPVCLERSLDDSEGKWRIARLHQHDSLRSPITIGESDVQESLHETAV
jgi:hypothetical protein